MADYVRCPHCAKKLRIAETAIGKKIKCPGCAKPFLADSVFEVDDAPAKTRGSDDRHEGQTPRKAKRAAASSAEDEARPARKPKKGGKQARSKALPWLVAGSVVGLLVLVGAGFAIYKFTRPSIPASAQSGGGASGTDGSASPAAPQVTIELSEPEATFTEEQVGNFVGPVLAWKVKYRVTQGQLDPKSWYMCQASLAGAGVSILEIQGKDLNPSGVFQQKAVVGQRKPESIKIEVLRGRGKGQYSDKISNVVTCSVR